MTKLGWAILAGIVLGLLAFGSMLSFGAADSPSPLARVKARVERPVMRDGALVVPVAGVARGALRDDWGDPRDGGARPHQGLDIVAPGGTPVLATAAGTIEKLFDSKAGGVTVYVRSPDRGWSYYYAHLSGYAPGVREGLRVAAGDPIGYVGDTGNAGVGNTHLHLGISRMRAGDRWWQGTPVDPYPLLARSEAAR